MYDEHRILTAITVITVPHDHYCAARSLLCHTTNLSDFNETRENSEPQLIAFLLSRAHFEDVIRARYLVTESRRHR